MTTKNVVSEVMPETREVEIESVEVDFILLDRDVIERSVRESKWDKYILPKLRGKLVTKRQLKSSYERIFGKISDQYLYHILERYVSKKVCTKKYNKSLGCNEYKF